VRASFLASDRTYGARRVWRDVLADGINCGLHKIERLMRQQALRARPRRRGLPRLSTKCCKRLKVVLRRPVEPKQYVSIRYTERLAQAGIAPSVGSVGDSYDNALAESIIGLFKAEVIRPTGPWRGLEAVEFATLEWVDWFNHRRLLEPIGYVPPAEAEAEYYAAQERQPLAA
jgi:transposase InsO family protein